MKPKRKPALARTTCSAAPTRREQLREAFAAMELEARKEYAEYVKRCGGIPISKVRPYTVPPND